MSFGSKLIGIVPSSGKISFTVPLPEDILCSFQNFIIVYPGSVSVMSGDTPDLNEIAPCVLTKLGRTEGSVSGTLILPDGFNTRGSVSPFVVIYSLYEL